jgi:tetraacyldisaccharide 4'-kinase
MRIRGILLWPFGLLYGGIAYLRRAMYQGLNWRKKAVLPTLVVGNITVGGTGKTPFVIWLSHQLKDRNPAVLSRGYGRNTQGFREVEASGAATEFGDEPMEIKGSLGANSGVYVCENRLEGVAQIKSKRPDVGCVLLDDGFQHLPLLPDASIVLCDYNRPFWEDQPMPAGNLREFAVSAKQADAIVITKCPKEMNAAEAGIWRQKLRLYSVPVFFAEYSTIGPVNSQGAALVEGASVVLVSALANNAAFSQGMKLRYSIGAEFAYRDHRAFTVSDWEKWENSMQEQQAQALVTTRKDWMRMRSVVDTPDKIFYTFTQVNFLFDGEKELIDLLLKRIQR